MAFGLGPLAAAPPAPADEFDVIIDPIINSTTGSGGTGSPGTPGTPGRPRQVAHHGRRACYGRGDHGLWKSTVAV